MADRHHFAKPFNCHNSAMGQQSPWNSLSWCILTLLNLVTDIWFLKTKAADGRCPGKSMVDIFKVTQQRTEPVRCGCR